MEIKDLVLQKPRFNTLVNKLRGLKASEHSVIQLKGLTGSAAATFLAPLKNAVDRIVVFVLNDEEKAGYFYHDLIQIGGEGGVSFFPSGYKRSIKYGQIDSANAILRTETLSSIQAIVQNQHSPSPASDQRLRSALLVVTYPEALAEKVAQSEEVKDGIITLHENEQVDPKFVAEVLFDRGFQRVDYVYEPGQFAVRGSILDVFSYSSEYPYRLDFFGNEIDSLRTFEVDSQLSKERLTEVTIAPSFSKDEVSGISLMEFLPPSAIIACEDVQWICERVFQITHQELSEQLMVTEEGDMTALQKLVDADRFKAELMKFNRIDISNRSTPENAEAARLLLERQAEGLA